jgi:hypothetical protein
VLGVWLGLAYLPFLQLRSAYAGPRFQPLPEIIAYVRENTRPDETILVWGKPSTYVYFSAQRNAPTRYFYQAPVYQADYNTDYHISASILRDLQLDPPRLFLYDHDPAGPLPASGCPLAYSNQRENSPEQIFAFICDRYAYEGQVSEFLVFRWKEGE